MAWGRNDLHFRGKRLLLSCIVVCVCVAGTLAQPADQAPACEAVLRIGPADSLRDLSTAYFGEPDYQWSILLATNAHAGEKGFTFIRDPYRLPAGANACIPGLLAANHLRASYQRYLRSVEQSRTPLPADVSTSLVEVDTSRPVKVVTWIREDQLAAFRKDGNAWIGSAPNDVWVTIVPMLKNFCRDFTSKHSTALRELTERLEERLGLPPLNGKTEFVEFTVLDPRTTAHLFRPCAAPSVSGTTCAAEPPAKDTAEPYKNWFFAQYYSSYGSARPYPYPWTSLGYTFDWALYSDGHSERFVQYGESEFVVPRGTPIRVESVSTTMQYCSAQR